MERRPATRSPLAVIAALGLVAAGCGDRPTPEEVDAAVRAYLASEIPTELLVQNGILGEAFSRLQFPLTHRVEVVEIRVVEFGEPWEDRYIRPYNTYYPVRVKVDCWATEADQRHRIVGEVELDLFEKPDGGYAVGGYR